ncbi:DDE-type integrase/transposase/recombinase [Candidatus Peregrinibacteria bacterium]|jgi:transposase InsO family protein|nr:DDE-type integrase/transposase/recombinase [Candidatus Peregrinibacteria bacterium]MBT4585614.1 DDE-type integrase/transposase/recombinase [Candidatus Peregrinibacteria bacterium]MBT6730369.1 DDE-type integrase/transposase/recombinase [Candidatus Peregrinibacteria bacterium]MBT7345274.1 DDE-type integrase/transposase/recombinase [Candidatus Peregrinibacteria bacterium]MBT7929716.1 DDE-type integrase/transposase/recombinase [Candidatus Peregrinibacteria bacterium]
MTYLNSRQRNCYKQRVIKDSYSFGASKTSRMYGIHRSTIYEWRKSIEKRKLGPKGRVSWQTPVQLERIVVRLRKQTNYGPKRLRVELEYHNIKLGEKAIRGILERRGLTKKHRRKRKKRHQVFYAPYAGYRLQVDTKAVPDIGRDLRSPLRYQFTAIDIYTKIRFLWIYEELSNYNSIDFLRRALEFYQSIGINVETVQTDNHMTFTNIFVGGNKKEDHQELRIHPLTEFLLDQGIHHLLSRPGTPTDNAFVERSHRTDGEEFYRTVNLSTLNNKELNIRIQKWTYCYNLLRPHSSCDNLPPLKYYLTVGQTGA